MIFFLFNEFLHMAKLGEFSVCDDLFVSLFDTPVCGVFGATIAAARLMKLDEAQTVSALGMAGAQASGLMEMYGPSMQKRFNPGPAARNGVTAAQMAKLGFYRRRNRSSTASGALAGVQRSA